MSLGDNATMCLSAVIAQVAAAGAGGEQVYRDVVQHTILDAVVKGLRSKTEVGTPASPSLLSEPPTVPVLSPQSVQQEYTNVLACLVKTFPTKKDFRDLVQLTNYSDPESDFFEHMKHIQVSANHLLFSLDTEN